MSELQFMELYTDEGLEELNRMIEEEQRDGWELVEKLAVFTKEEYEGEKSKAEMHIARMQRTSGDELKMAYVAAVDNLTERCRVLSSSDVVL